MNIFLIDNDYKYAVEQMLLTMFPDEKPRYPEEMTDGKKLIVSLNMTQEEKTALCTYTDDNGSTFSGCAKMPNKAKDIVETDSENSRLVKDAIYKALLSSGIKRPVWGSLTGVRPGKLMLPMLEAGMSDREATEEFIKKYDVSQPRAKMCLETSHVTLSVKNSLSDKDICLYIGVPFCPTRCSYCSFISVDTKNSAKYIEPFVEALKKEIVFTAETVKKAGLNPVSVYFGGGTPTSLSASQLDDVLAILFDSFKFNSLRELTVEAGRPDTITEEKLSVLKKYGVDRISVNPQTMSDSVLETIGRKHTAQDIIDCFSLVRRCGGFSVNMDLIAGLPSDSLEGFKQTVDKVIFLNPENITVHTLSRKKGANLNSFGTDNLPSGNQVAQMLEYANGRLREEGYSPYYLYRQKFMSGGFENTGWCKQGFENIYNVCIMEETNSIIAMGAGASTKLIAPGNRKNLRIISPKYPKEYIEGIDKVLSSKNDILSFYNCNN